MINRIVKYSLIALFTALCVYNFTVGNIGNGIMFIFLIGLVVLFIFKDERILWAFYQLRKNRPEKTREILDKIKRPDLLVKSQEGYYYYLLGLVESQVNSLTKAEKFFKRALSIGLRMDHDKAMAKLNLAGICLAKRKKREAVQLLAEAKKLDKHKMLSDQIKMIQEQLKRI